METRKRLNAKTEKPLYRQLAEILKEDIFGFPEGSRFYTDRELCRKFGVSQPVVRKALSILVREGYIHRNIPKGTFVKKRKSIPVFHKNKKIGVICRMEAFMPHTPAVKGVQEVVSAEGFETLVFPLNVDVEMNSSETSLEKVRETLRSVDGVVWVSSILRRMQSPGYLSEIAPRIVAVNALLQNEIISCVAADHEMGAYRLTERLISSGYRRIGYIGSNKERLSAILRYRGFEHAMQDHGLDTVSEIIIPFTSEEDSSLTDKYIRRVLTVARSGGTEALFAYHDSMAMKVIEIARDLGVRIPRDMALVGFDDLFFAEKLRPALTTVRLPYYEQGKMAARILLDQLYRRTEPGGKYLVPCPLIIRESCGTRENGMETAKEVNETAEITA